MMEKKIVFKGPDRKGQRLQIVRRFKLFFSWCGWKEEPSKSNREACHKSSMDEERKSSATFSKPFFLALILKETIKILFINVAFHFKND